MTASPPATDTPSTAARLALAAGWLALAVLLILYARRPVMDLDFWWHLKTGDLILQQHSLPKSDPFNYTGNPAVSGREAVILHGYWLWQVTASLLFRLWSFTGIFLLKLATVGLLAWAARREMVRLLVPPALQLALAAAASIAVLTVYNPERPQVWSVFFLTVLVAMIARIRDERRPDWLLPPMMLLWSNIHGGFVVGDLVLGLAAAGFLVEFRQDRQRLTTLWLWAGSGILASFVNPNGWNAFLETFNFLGQSIGTAFIAEYRSSLFIFTGASKTAAVCLWLISLLVLTGCWRERPRYWPGLLVAVFLVVFGNRYLRNTGFVAVSLLPLAGAAAAREFARLGAATRRYGAIAAWLVAAGLLAHQLAGEIRLQRNATGPIADSFTVGMANYLKQTGLTGNLFNDFGMGGYLAWALYPQRQTFIDGRELDTGVSRHYLDIALGNQTVTDGKPLYELMLDNYRIDLVAMRLSLASGELQPLLKLLLLRPEWTPVYLDWNSFVLARRTVANLPFLSKNAIDKTDFLAILTRLTEERTRENPDYAPLAVRLNDINAWQAAMKGPARQPAAP